ncbi:transcriptional regulatory protein Ash1p [[Candida] railenensis]|uniref:Transcriptional regulatory protein Ash1p n=1 Tax=[Candida] railenensis TaxID=45579 RepID=A0A9P0QSN5_9ASCO|nr:transcriptional regulatory protein Ash1p [[Candida] railenensis]
MSMLHTHVYNGDHFKPGHARSRSYNELLSQFKTAISSSSPTAKLVSSPTTPNTTSRSSYVKKRSYSDLMKDTPSMGSVGIETTKRSRTAPPSPPYEFPVYEKASLRPTTLNLKNHRVIRSRSLSPNKKTSFLVSNPISPSDSPATSPVLVKNETVAAKPGLAASQQPKITQEETAVSPATNAATPAAVVNVKSVQLPSLSTALQSTPMTSVKLNPIAPTVSLDYFDTYKPNDENWRYELLDSITKSSKSFNLNRYNYLNRAGTQLDSLKSAASGPVSPPSTSPYKVGKPSFNSKISSKILHPISERSTAASTKYRPYNSKSIRKSYSEKKIKFPYESNYTYLNKTYMTDVEKYPEYLELAQSLISLSQSDQNSYAYSPPQSAVAEPQPYYKQQQPTHQHQPQQFHQPLHQSSIPLMASIPAIIPSPPSISTPHQTIVSPIMSALPHPHLHHHQYHPQHHHHHPAQTGFSTFMSTYDVPSTPQKQQKSVPLTPPSSKSKSRSELLKSPPKSSQQQNTRVCISCGSDQSPCWRPSWSIKEGQLCNSCGLRYKKTAARCLNKECKKIPAKGEWSLMQSKGKSTFEDGNEGFSCLDCGWRVEVKK